jgi:NAD(P)H-flavin reductase
MATILFRETKCTLDAGETVLDGLLRHGFDIPNSCRGGTCHSCLLQATSGDVPAVAQSGLKDTWKERGYFKPCVCRPEPEAEIEVQSVGDAEVVPAEILSIDRLSPTVARVWLLPDTPLQYEPGQFLSLIRADGLTRSYSIASLPDEGVLELHVRIWPGGQMSTWLHEEAQPGDRVLVRGAHGECFYTNGQKDRPLLLIGTGTGLAPLWGIVRQALRQGHRGPITLIHGAVDSEGLYLCEELAALARTHDNITYIPTLRDRQGKMVEVGSIDDIARAMLAEFGGPGKARAYICGDDKIVRTIRRVLFLAGMSINDIFYDAFTPTPLAPNAELAQVEARVASSAA